MNELERLPDLYSLSPSRISKFQSCNLRYRLYYIDRIRVKRINRFFAYGLAMDKALERFLLSVRDCRFNPFKDSLELFVYEILQYDDTNCDWVGNSYGNEDWISVRDMYLQRGKRLLGQFNTDWLVRVQSMYLLGTQVKLPVFDVNDYKLEGYIDVLYRDVHGIDWILDFKTSSSSILYNEMKYFYQLWFYASCMGRENAGKPYHAQIIAMVGYKRYNKDYETIQTLDKYRFTNSHYVKFFDHLHVLTNQLNHCINYDLFPMTYDRNQCAWCDYNRLCWGDSDYVNEKYYTVLGRKADEIKTE